MQKKEKIVNTVMAILMASIAILVAIVVAADSLEEYYKELYAKPEFLESINGVNTGIYTENDTVWFCIDGKRFGYIEGDDFIIPLGGR